LFLSHFAKKWHFYFTDFPFRKNNRKKIIKIVFLSKAQIKLSHFERPYQFLVFVSRHIPQEPDGPKSRKNDQTKI